MWIGLEDCKSLIVFMVYKILNEDTIYKVEIEKILEVN